MGYHKFILMKKLYQFTIKDYLDVLASHKPIPGGGSAAALMGAAGVALIIKVTHYSIKKSQAKEIRLKLKKILHESVQMKSRLISLIDLDAQAYLKVVQSRQSDARTKRAALALAKKIPQDVCHLCYSAIQLTSFLVEKGNPFLLSDLEAAIEALSASFNSALSIFKSNQ